MDLLHSPIILAYLFLCSVDSLLHSADTGAGVLPSVRISGASCPLHWPQHRLHLLSHMVSSIGAWALCGEVAACASLVQAGNGGGGGAVSSFGWHHSGKPTV